MPDLLVLWILMAFVGGDMQGAAFQTPEECKEARLAVVQNTGNVLISDCAKIELHRERAAGAESDGHL